MHDCYDHVLQELYIYGIDWSKGEEASYEDQNLTVAKETLLNDDDGVLWCT